MDKIILDVTNPFGPDVSRLPKCMLIATYGIKAGSHMQYTDDFLSQFPNLKVVSRVGAGVDNIDHEYCQAHGIAIENTPDAPTQAVAEYVLYQILNNIRNYHDSTWNNKLVGKQISQLTVGIIGNGRIGKRVAKLLQPFGCELLINDIVPEKSHCTIENLFRFSDVITVHIPLNKENHHFINQRLLNTMLPAVIFINTSRGDVVNEVDLQAFLREHSSSKAILDVFSHEPYNGPLTNFANCTITPHIAWATSKAEADMHFQATENAQKYK